MTQFIHRFFEALVSLNLDHIDTSPYHVSGCHLSPPQDRYSQDQGWRDRRQVHSNPNPVCHNSLMSLLSILRSYSITYAEESVYWSFGNSDIVLTCLAVADALSGRAKRLIWFKFCLGSERLQLKGELTFSFPRKFIIAQT